MEAKKCDRCGAYYAEIMANNAQQIIHDVKYVFSNDYKKNFDTLKALRIYIDLCKDCENSFVEWFKGGKKNEDARPEKDEERC